MLPTNPTAFTTGWSHSASTASRPPCTMLKTPSGSPDSFRSSASRSVESGTRSLGLRMNALPPTSACGSIHSGTMSGKLNGVTPATTPSGAYATSQATPRLTSSWLPAARFGSEQPYSTHSIAFSTSAFASPNTLPFSCETSHESSSMCLTISSRRR